MQSLSSSVLNRARITAERAKADATARANAAAFTALGASNTVLANLENARVQLSAAIEASGGVQSNITTAWATYNSYIRTELKAQVHAAVQARLGPIVKAQMHVTTI